MNYKISVIIPAYNVLPYIRKSLDSVVNQTYKNLEIILIDDGSTDGTGAICDEYAQKDSRITVIHQQNAGLSAARNVGIERSEGEWIAFLDSDDWVEPQMYEILLKVAQENDADISTCKSRKCYLGENEPLAQDDGQVTVLTTDDIIAGLRTQEKVRFEVWNKLWRRSLIDNVRFKVGQIYEDVYFDRTLFFKANKMVFINTTLHNYLITRPGNTNSSFKLAKLCIFPELNAFIEDLKLQQKDELVEIVSCIAIDFAISLYNAAICAKQSAEIKDKILGYFDGYYELAKSSRFRNKKALFLFRLSPSIYIEVVKWKERKRENERLDGLLAL
jgi:glycosyltransferase involved in cell wall biosynthesis